MRSEGNVIKTLMVKQGRKQKELADYLGLSESSLSHLLKRGTFNRETMIKIAKFLNVDLTFFNRGDGTKSSGMTTHSPNAADENSIENLERIIEALKQTIESQKELIETLKAQIKK